MSNGKAWQSRGARDAIKRVRRIERELADWPMTEARRREKEREIRAIRVQFNL